MCFYGLGVFLSYFEAMKWLRKAADQGNAKARRFLGAIKWHQAIAERGNTVTQFIFGDARESGYRVAKNETSKQHCAVMEAGEAELHYNLGLMYYEGRGEVKGEAKNKAIKQFRKAAKLGHAGAKNNLKRMGETLY
ncbi:MAG: hypothetical protein LBE32_00960 [Burkholderiales bacterium]|jgi:TPR repeat protein|nr:hypothetical protein [Burkholderiales bacterium]